MANIGHKRHIAKTITWRFVGTTDTIVLSWLITGNPLTGLKIGFLELVSKMVLYYLHERAWFNIAFPNSNQRHLIKTLTWRAIGTLDTMLLSWLVSGNPLTGVKIGLAEVVSKMILYYLHERTWYRINFGLDKRKRAKKWKRI